MADSTATDEALGIESLFQCLPSPEELPLRPASLDDFIGQEALREKLNVLIGAARMRNEPLGHCLLWGPPGLGKTTISHIIAKAMGTNIVVTSGPVLEKAADLAGILTNLKDGDVLFIDEIHRLPRSVEEYLYPAMEDFRLDLVIDTGPSARSVRVQLSRFTLVGATTRLGLISSPLRSRFAFNGRLDFYPTDVLERILARNARLLGMTVEQSGFTRLARSSRGTPRIANTLLRWTRDFAATRGFSTITDGVVHKSLELLNVDERGLDEMDLRLLYALIDQYDGGPVGIQTLSCVVGEEASTIEEVHEPFLIMQGLLERTPRGRKATKEAYIHLQRPIPAKFTCEETQ